MSGASAEDREIAFFNIHTKENISVVYKRDGKYVPEAMSKLNSFMRDWRRNITVKMDPALIDLIWEIHTELGSKKPVHLICGHRSGATNEGLRRTRGGQAKNSKHITGEAADIHFPDISAKQLRNSALIRERGGVGYYPTSAIPFVHVDTGNVRHWPRLPRQELAVLFPSGRSKHTPSDGRPITKQDFQVALASLQKRGGELPVGVQRLMAGNKGQAPTVLASLAPVAPKTPPVIQVSAPDVRPPQPDMVFASMTPSFGGFGGEADQPDAKSEKPQPLLQARTQQTAARADEDFKRDFLRQEPEAKGGRPSNLVPDDQMAATPEYDDDHPDELDYQPFPILPFMSDTPIASMDMSVMGEATELSLAKVHVMFTESKEMLHAQFQPGLQYAQMYWAQRFRGSAVNTGLKRLARKVGDEPVKTAQNTAAGK